MNRATLYVGDVRACLRRLSDESVHTVVTSPPYWGLRRYETPPQVWGGDAEYCEHDDEEDPGHNWMPLGRRHKGGPQGKGGQRVNRDVSAQNAAQDFPTGETCVRCGAWRGELGLEPSPALYVAHVVEVFREVRRVLRDDGTLWLNMGDGYTDSGRGSDVGSTLQGSRQSQAECRKVRVRENAATGLQPKNLLGMPWRVALALQDDGWYLRQDNIWHKRNAMPESVGDRTTRAHEYVFHFAKSEYYFYDGQAIAEPLSPDTHPRYARGRSSRHKYADGGPGGQTIAMTFDHMAKPGVGKKGRTGVQGRERSNPSFLSATVEVQGKYTSGNKRRRRGATEENGITSDIGRSIPWDNVNDLRNARSVWDIPSQSYKGAHFATFPEELARRCIVAGSKSGGMVLDPFGGSGTVAAVAIGNGRDAIHIDLKYHDLARHRIGPAFCKVVA